MLLNGVDKNTSKKKLKARKKLAKEQRKKGIVVDYYPVECKPISSKVLLLLIISFFVILCGLIIFIQYLGRINPLGLSMFSIVVMVLTVIFGIINALFFNKDMKEDYLVGNVKEVQVNKKEFKMKLGYWFVKRIYIPILNHIILPYVMWIGIPLVLNSCLIGLGFILALILFIANMINLFEKRQNCDNPEIVEKEIYTKSE